MYKCDWNLDLYGIASLREESVEILKEYAALVAGSMDSANSVGNSSGYRFDCVVSVEFIRSHSARPFAIDITYTWRWTDYKALCSPETFRLSGDFRSSRWYSAVRYVHNRLHKRGLI